MKKTYVLWISLITGNLFSQDIINLKDGNEIYSKVLKVTDTEIEYKKFSNLDGPVYVKKKSDILNIKYQNGNTETFNTSEKSNTESNNAFTSYQQTDKALVIEPPVNDNIGIAEVNQINGLDVYFMNKPLLKYTVVFSSGDFLSDIDLKSIFWGGLSRHHVHQKMQKLVNAAYRKATELKVPIHGIIYSSGNHAIIIQYAEDSIPSIKLAKVDTFFNREIYVLAKPYKKEYTISGDKAAKSGGFGSFISLGIVNSTMDEDIKEMIKSFNPKWHNIDAVLYLEGKKGQGIKFK